MLKMFRNLMEKFINEDEINKATTSNKLVTKLSREKRKPAANGTLLYERVPNKPEAEKAALNNISPTLLKRRAYEEVNGMDDNKTHKFIEASIQKINKKKFFHHIRRFYEMEIK
uniref:Uncharacterized protein n=1 Tax=Timema cristinae TaxID=61476 RepID=A0A7R9CE35_TIMCR|nr:unnamed protein product [Timema cristinae]